MKTRKILLIVIAVMMIAGSVALSACGAVKKATEEVKKAVDSVIDIAPEVPAVTDGDGNVLDEGETYPMPENLIFGGAAKASAALASLPVSVTLHATVLPDAAVVKSVVWSVSFVNADSAWASGKTVTDYVTVTPASEFSPTATVICTAAFGEQIKITASSLFDLKITASCLVDFRVRLSDVGVLSETYTNSIFFPNGVHSLSTSEINIVSPLLPLDLVSSSVYDLLNLPISPALNYSFGTMYPSSISYVFSIILTSDLLNNLSSKGINVNSAGSMDGTFYSYYMSFCPLPRNPNVSNEIWSERTVMIDKVNAAVSACTGEYDFELIVNLVASFDVPYSYEYKSYIFKCKFDRSSIVFAPTGVSLSPGSIAF